MKGARIALLGLGLLLIGPPSPALAGDKDNTVKPRVDIVDVSCAGRTVNYEFLLRNVGDAEGRLDLHVKVEAFGGKKRIETISLQDPPFGEIILGQSATDTFKGQVTLPAGTTKIDFKIRVRRNGREKPNAKESEEVTCS